jgi:metal-responsive CopG/Arc/MetJ family transcriptional regulator
MMTRMRTIIDLPAAQLDALDAVCRREGISRAEAIRRAVAATLEQTTSASRAAAFGLWRGRRGTDGPGYQRRVRREWR